MATATSETLELGQCGRQEPMQPVHLTEKASKAVKSILDDQRHKCLSDLAPELIDVYNAFNREKGQGPTFAELASKAGLSENDLLVKLGTAAAGKADYISQEFRDAYRELYSANGRGPTSAELAAKANVPESDLILKLGKAAAVILGKVFLRLRVVGGGCSGFQHKLDLDPEMNPKLDEIFEFHGIPLAIDKRSLMYINGITVDFHDDLNRRGFSISNPNAKTTCGCGSSFSM